MFETEPGRSIIHAAEGTDVLGERLGAMAGRDCSLGALPDHTPEAKNDFRKTVWGMVPAAGFEPATA